MLDNYPRKRLAAWGRRLGELIAARDMNQSEFARACEKQAERPFGRDLISNYLRGKHVPDKLNQKAMAAALGITVDELMAPLYQRGQEAPEQQAFTLAGNGMVAVNVTVPHTIAAKIMELLA